MLRPLQSIFPPGSHPDLLVGLGTPDDAAVWRLEDTRLLVVTMDFFTPVVDDPYDYGAVAAANALSDVYAMGARPVLALNVAAMPVDLDLDVVAEIFRGGAEKVREAGAVVAGGHTVQDKEPKFGLVAVGLGDEASLITKGGARPGDRLVLTKPLGTGVIATALKNGRASPEHVAEATRWMVRLNATAADLARHVGVRGGTDVTGFGLLGHAAEMAEASGVGLRFYFEAVPFLAGAREYGEAGFFPGGSQDNARYFGRQVRFDPALDETSRLLLFDAQTSGGLLLAVPEDRLDAFEQAAAEADQPIWVVGEVVEGRGLEVTASSR